MVRIYNDGWLTVLASTFADNRSGRGGGLYNASSAVAIVVNSSFGNNQATHGRRRHPQPWRVDSDQQQLCQQQRLRQCHPQLERHAHLYNNLLAGTCVNSGTLATSVNNFVQNGGCNATFSGTAYLASLGNYGGETANLCPFAQQPSD